MRTIIAKAPAYGMPTLAGAVNKPEKVNAIPPGPPSGRVWSGSGNQALPAHLPSQ